MGTPMAVSYANIFMSEFKLYLLFLVQIGDEASFKYFLAYCNEYSKSRDMSQVTASSQYSNPHQIGGQEQVLQALAYEACDHMRMLLLMPKTLETYKKSTPCLIQKASKCAADCTSKKTFFSFTFYKTQRSYQKIMCVYFLFHWFSGENCMFLLSLHKGKQT